MPEHYDQPITNAFCSSEAVSNASSTYSELLPKYSVRANHVLENLKSRFDNEEEFLRYLAFISREKVLSLRNSGSKTANEIMAIASHLKKCYESNVIDRTKFEPNHLPSNIDSIFPLLSPHLSILSVRARNGFNSLLKLSNNSLSLLYSMITAPSFKPAKIKNIGRGTVHELDGFLNYVQVFLESFPNEAAVEEAISDYFAKSLDEVFIPSEHHADIRSLEKSLGYFPLFAAIKAYFTGLQGETRTLLDGTLIVHENQTLPGRDEVASALGLTAERVRQKRNKLIEKLTSYFTSYKTLGFVKDNPYKFQMTSINEQINATEGTDFTLNFVNWVIGTTYEEATVLGDILRAIGGYFDKENSLYLVPTNLCQLMDFAAFIEDIESRLAEKKINEVRVNLEDIIKSHLKTQYCEDDYPSIETACRSILYLHFPVEVDYGQIIFKPNARKNNPIIAEEILRAAGHPLTLEEIYEEFIYQYPERYTEMNSFRGSIQSNPNILSIGRSSTYSLLEWDSGTRRGGTIREFVCEYLDSLNPPIAPAEDVYNYVRRFRPSSSDSSISANLQQEKNNKFVVLVRDGIRYFGYTDREYDASFSAIAGNQPVRRTTEESMTLLEEFILEKGHFPYSGESGSEERRLYRFVSNRRYACMHNSIPIEDIKQWQEFEEKYREFDIPLSQRRRTVENLGETDNV